jgi:hypothetical protein
MAKPVDRYKLALLLLTLAVVPLFYLNIWLGMAALVAAYALIARFANRHFDNQSRKSVKPVRHRQRR